MVHKVFVFSMPTRSKKANKNLFTIYVQFSMHENCLPAPVYDTELHKKSWIKWHWEFDWGE